MRRRVFSLTLAESSANLVQIFSLESRGKGLVKTGCEHESLRIRLCDDGGFFCGGVGRVSYMLERRNL